jgi:hypothetical protein
MIQVLYRISDGGNPKTKLPGAGKQQCLENCMSEFGPSNIRVFADNCRETTLEMLEKLGLQYETIALGNAMSWRYVAEYAIRTGRLSDNVYLLEDDYLHKPGSAKALEEALEFADYATLYDHPDKYLDAGKGGPNPYVENGAENTRVWLTSSCHWKQTNSTTMTFATKIKTLAEDKDIWWEFTSQGFPNDFGAFQRLQGLGSWESRLFGKKRILVSAIPGFSSHAETAWLSPHSDWEKF